VIEAQARSAPTYALTRALFLRWLGAIYFIAFWSLERQVLALFGAHGVLPAAAFLARVRAAEGCDWASAVSLPSIFWLGASDRALLLGAWIGLGLSVAVVLGLQHVAVLVVLWALYMSFVHVGQIFYGYGWEILLLETGFLAIFLGSVKTLRPMAARDRTPTLVLALVRWLLFRVMIGAGLIKLRGDSCWRDLTCLYYHYETQPLPNPLSPWFHHLPHAVLRGGVAWNHAIELFFPWLLFGPVWMRRIAGVLLASFQGVLIASGNLSFLNWLTIGLTVACFDDEALGWLLPRAVRERRLAEASSAGEVSTARRRVTWALTGLVALLSVGPVVNMLSPGQAMNASFDPLHLVNTYGAFGSVGRERNEIVLEGTDAAEPDDRAEWRAYELPCKPGDPMRRPCVVAPFQWRLDWQIWFAAMSRFSNEPWLARVVWKLLENDRAVLGLFANDPFPDRPPRFIRGVFYSYRFAEPSDPPGAWWHRERLGLYFPPVSLSDPRFRAFVERLSG